MKKDLFFGFLGRANAVILFFAGLGVLGLMGYGISETWKENRRGRVHHPTWEYRQPQRPDPLEDPALPQGRFQRSGYTSWVFAELEVERRGTDQESPGIEPVRANYLFLDTETGNTRWLKADNSGSVDYLDFHDLYGFEWEDVEFPFNLYSARDRSPLPGLAISAQDGSDFHFLVKEIGKILFARRNSAGNATIVHRLADELWIVEIDPGTRKLVRHDKVEVAPVGNPKS